jgi:hypothetical protein
MPGGKIMAYNESTQDEQEGKRIQHLGTALDALYDYGITELFSSLATSMDSISTRFANKRAVYNILFRTSAETLRIIAADPRHLGAEIGFFSVLHTWGKNLLHTGTNSCSILRRFVRSSGLSMQKKPFAGPKKVLDYIGRYTHRIAISNNRLLDIDDGRVRFRWKRLPPEKASSNTANNYATSSYLTSLPTARCTARRVCRSSVKCAG